MKRSPPNAPLSDQSNFRVAFSENFDDICRFVARRSDSADVEAVVSEAFFAAWKQWANRPRAPNEIRPWLFGFARNTTLATTRHEMAVLSSSLRGPR